MDSVVLAYYMYGQQGIWIGIWYWDLGIWYLDSHLPAIEVQSGLVGLRLQVRNSDACDVRTTVSQDNMLFHNFN